MAIDKSVDSTLLDAAMSYEAGKIRAKLGSSSQINYDLANGKGFGDAIAAIPTGGGGQFASGTYTPATNETTATFDVGGDFSNFVLYLYTWPSFSVRGLRVVCCDFDNGNPVRIAVTTNNNGGGVVGFYNTTGWVTKSGNTMIYASQSNNTSLIADATYKWVAW